MATTTEKSPHRIQSFVMIDLEATGLGGISRLPRITELAMVAVSRESLCEQRIQPRVRHELKFCVNPRKLIEHGASTITGLYNDMLEQESAFDTAAVDLINSFLSRLTKPVCLLAHNGNGFDYKVLHAELKRNKGSLISGLLCADSLVGFRELDRIKFEKQFKNNNGNIISGPVADDISGWQIGEMTPKRKVGQYDGNTTAAPPKRPSKHNSNANHSAISVKKNLQFSMVDVPGEAANDKTCFVKKCGESGEKLSEISQQKSLHSLNCIGNRTCVDAPQSKSVENVTRNSSGASSRAASPRPCMSETPCTVEKNVQALGIIDEISKKSSLGVVHNVSESNKSSSTEQIQAKVTENVVAKSLNTSDGTASTTETRTSMPALDSQMSDASDSLLINAIVTYENNTGSNEKLQQKNISKDSTNIVCNTSATLSKTSQNCTAGKSSTNIQEKNMMPEMKKASYKLEDIYKRHFGCSPSNSHSAGDDCLTLLAVLGKNSTEFVEWIDENAVDFSTFMC